MTTQERIDAAMAHLGQSMGMELRLDENRACRLVFDDSLGVDFEVPETLADTLVMTCTLSNHVSPDVRGSIYQTLLEANFFARGTGGGVLGYDEGRQEIVLQRMLQMTHADGADLLNALERLLSDASAWVERLQASVPAGSGPQSERPDVATYFLKA